MDFHLERKLRLHTEPDHKSLYSWAINEIDENGDIVGSDQIPWRWTLYFTATSCVLGDGIELKSNWPLKKTDEPASTEISQRQVIRTKLRSGRPSDDGDYFRETKYSMFGTDRAITEFQLDIHSIADPTENESCTAWGSPSYTAETDFRNETTDDCLVFYLFVKPETFARYAAKISHGAVDEIVLAVGAVDGFYSEWSPSISTRDVKVLTRGDEHKVERADNAGLEPPRLGSVGDAKLYINRRLEFGMQKSDDETLDEDTHDLGTIRITPEAHAPGSNTDPQVIKALVSLRRAAWWIVVLLALLFITLLLRR